MQISSWELVLGLSIIVPLALGGIVKAGSKNGSCDLERLEAFECGFEAMSSARSPFSLKFFMVVIIFLVFDVEVVLVLPIPVAKTLMAFSYWGWISMGLMVVLILGLVVEFEQGAFEWAE